VTHALVALAIWGSLAVFASNDSLPPSWLVIAGLAIFAGAFFLAANRRLLLALLGAALLLAGSSLWLQTELLKPSWLGQLAQVEQSAQLELEILNRPKVIFSDFSNRPNYGVSVRLRVLDNKAVSGRGYLIYANQELERGDRVKLEGMISPAGKNPRDAFLVKPKGEMSVVAKATGSLAFFNQLRSGYVSKLAGITPDAAVLVSGLAIGEISQLDPVLEERMRTVSLTHLVAVSGSNCAIVVGLVYLIAVRLRFGRRGRTIASLIALVLYVLLVGPDPSVLRAAVMSASVILAIALGRRAFALNALSLAALILLIADPWLAVEFGFGLSVLATAGILLLAPALAEKLALRMPKLLALGLSVTISAQLMCLPLLMQLQPGIPTYSILANLFAAPAVAPVTVLGILGVLATLVVPALVEPISYLASLGGFWIELIANTMAQLPVAYFPWLTGAMASVVSVVGIFAFSAWIRSKVIGFRSLGISTLVVIVIASLTAPAAAELVPSKWPGEWSLVACDVGQGDALVIRSEQRVALIDVGRDEQLIDSCLSDLGVSRIDLLVLTHFDFDHVGGLPGAMKNRTVDVAIISGFKDERPATAIAIEQLKDSNLVIAQPQVTGKLGEFEWHILAPTREALEAKDSNDASVVMLFRSSEMDILLLGDLGEAGQNRIQAKTLAKLAASSKPLILKVSHHGSNDQSAEFHQILRPDLAVISVGRENGYGHPGSGALDILSNSGAMILRTDQLGSIALEARLGALSWAASGR